MNPSTNDKLDIGVLLPGVGVFGGVRRFIEIGNELVRRGHRYTLYHPTGEPPAKLNLRYADDSRTGIYEIDNMSVYVDFKMLQSVPAMDSQPRVAW